MVFLNITIVVIIGVIFARVSQVLANGCTISVNSPLAILTTQSQSSPNVYPIGTTLKFFCIKQNQIKYILEGAPKLLCGKDGAWSSKIPRCKATLCSPTPPTVLNAQSVTAISPGQNNKIGDIVQYKCMEGYKSQYLTKVCQKNGYWQGSVSCKRITCVAPVLVNGNVSYTSLDYGAIVRYTCSHGYALTGPHTRTCGDHGEWSGKVDPYCSKLCPRLKNPTSGHYTPHSNAYKKGTAVKLVCTDRYVVNGSPTRTCGDNGEWNGMPSKCVINSCGHPGKFINGHINQNKPNYVIGTTLKFYCFSGYKLQGPLTRQCLGTGRWSEVKNPICVELFCKEPGHMLHGDHNQEKKSKYPYGTKLVYTCNSHYYMWGKSGTLECIAENLTPYWSNSPPMCLTLIQFNSKCQQANGHFYIENGHPDCVIQAPFPTTSNLVSSTNRHSMDTLTIVTASAGSTLGVLVIILSIMIFVRRFHRNRRLRQNNIRSRFYSDDDHVTLIACPRGFHFALPSYDEAMSQTQRDPPPFESVVSANGTTTINNNSDSTPSYGDRPDDRTALEVSNDQQVHIVSNPLTESQQRNESESISGANPEENSNRNSISSQDSLVISEPPSSHDGTALSLSDDEQSVNESAPLIGSN